MELLVFIITILVVSAIGGFIYLLYWPIKLQLIKHGKLSLKRSGQVNTIYVVAIFLCSIYLTIDAFFPGERFYEKEFNRVTLHRIPSSAEFVSKHASYPDFHGDYCSSSQIRLDHKDYQILLEELSRDVRLTYAKKIVGFHEFTATIGDKDLDRIVAGFTREIVGEEDHYLFIGFYDDGQTIFVNVCVT